MRILIFSVSAGGGHKHAAEAIKSSALLQDPNCEVKIIDTLKYINPIIDKVIIGSYLKSLKVTPSLFGKLYHFTEKDENIANMSNKINEILSSKILPLIKEFDPDVVIATHPFPAEMLSKLKAKKLIQIPFICILTDYSPHSFWIRPETDAYVVSNYDMKEEMVLRGVNRNSIFDLGIPVSPNFVSYFDKEDIFSPLGFNPEVQTVLVMGGSLGMGKIIDVYNELTNINIPIQIIVIAGKNKKLYNELSLIKEGSPKKTAILGYTKEVNKFMNCCDLLITKPGGLTITEALVCKVPLALFSPILGPEERNAQFLIKHNLGVSIGDGSKCRDIIEQLLKDKNKLAQMRKNCDEFSKPSSGDDLMILINDLIKKKEVAITLQNKSDR